MNNDVEKVIDEKEEILKSIDKSLEKYPMFLSRKQVMEILEISRPTVTRLINKKIIKGVKVTPNTHLKIPKLSIKNYLIELHTGK